MKALGTSTVGSFGSDLSRATFCGYVLMQNLLKIFKRERSFGTLGFLPLGTCYRDISYVGALRRRGACRIFRLAPGPSGFFAFKPVQHLGEEGFFRFEASAHFIFILGEGTQFGDRGSAMK